MILQVNDLPRSSNLPGLSDLPRPTDLPGTSENQPKSVIVLEHQDKEIPDPFKFPVSYESTVDVALMSGDRSLFSIDSPILPITACEQQSSYIGTFQYQRQPFSL